MKLVRFGEANAEKPGILDSEGRIRDLSSIVDDIAGNALAADGMAKIAAADINNLPLAGENTRYGACVGNVGKFICIGLNYADHAAETGAEVPQEPVIFTKATSAITGPNDGIAKPKNSTKLDWEVELGVVIGEEARYVSEEEASKHIAGYCVVHDVSERHFQLERGGQWDKGKGCDTFGPIGPYLVTPEEAGDIDNLHLWLKVNGKTYQDGSTSSMVFRPAFLVHYLSQFMSLQPGDVISTGTPPGVGLGQTPPVFLNVGDKIELGIDGLGEQTQIVRNWNE